MPGRNGTGPAGGSKGRGGAGGGFGFSNRDGICRCPNCGEKVAHIRAQPCAQRKCPKCGTLMVRDD